MPSPYFITRDSCPVCGSSSASELYSAAFDKPPVRDYLDHLYAAQGEGVEYEYLAGDQFVVLGCSGCGLVYQRDVPADALMRRLYGRWIKPEKIFAIDAGKPRAGSVKEIKILFSYLRRTRTLSGQLSVYDYGMGWGIWLRSAQAAGCEVFGTELIDEKCAVAAAGGVRCIKEEDLPGKTFDLINAESVLEHLRFPRETLKKLSAALRPGGLLRIVVPVIGMRRLRSRFTTFATAPSASRTDLIAPISPLEHVNCFCGNSLKKLTEDAGLERTHLPLALRYACTFDWTIKGLVKPAASLFSYRFMPCFFRRK
jgi:SAM-dependent methyltransferase